MSNTIGILAILMLAWGSVPCGILMAFAAFYGCRAQCETTWWLGPGAPLAFQFSTTRFYWCPLGFVGLEVKIL